MGQGTVLWDREPSPVPFIVKCRYGIVNRKMFGFSFQICVRCAIMTVRPEGMHMKSFKYLLKEI